MSGIIIYKVYIIINMILYIMIFQYITSGIFVNFGTLKTHKVRTNESQVLRWEKNRNHRSVMQKVVKLVKLGDST